MTKTSGQDLALRQTSLYTHPQIRQRSLGGILRTTVPLKVHARDIKRREVRQRDRDEEEEHEGA